MGYYKSASALQEREIHLLFKQAFFSLLIIAKVSNRASFAVFTYKCLRKNEGECPTTTALGLELVVRSSTIGCQTCHFHPLYTSLSISSCKLATWGAVSCWFLQAFDIWPNEETKYNWDYHSDFLITLYESYHQSDIWAKTQRFFFSIFLVVSLVSFA